MATSFPDIYFLPDWGEFFETKEREGKVHYFTFKHRWGHVFYQFILRPTPVQLGGPIYHDIITPYGFSGPIILSGDPERKHQLVALFNQEFRKYCEAHRIVTEYVRFNPWLKNRLDFEQFYEFRDNGFTLYIDLTVYDFFTDQFSAAARNKVRKAQKNNVEIEIDYSGQSVPQFHRLYMQTVERHKIEPYYQFSEELLQASFVRFKGKQFLVNAKHKGRYVSSSLMLHHGEYMHYHLAANDPAFYSLAGNSLIIYEACKWAVENGKKQLHLGGARNDDLYRFKRNFTNTEPLKLLMGKRIHDHLVYDQLVEKKRETEGIQFPGYFPLYRG